MMMDVKGVGGASMTVVDASARRSGPAALDFWIGRGAGHHSVELEVPRDQVAALVTQLQQWLNATL